MTATSTGTLEYRAATYFGMQEEPRTSIKVSRYKCIIVAQREPGRRVLAVYDEARGMGEYLSLTDDQRQALWEALDVV